MNAIETTVALPALAPETSVILRSYADEPIREARDLIVFSDRYPTAELAWSTGERYQRALVRAFARLRIGADFGSRASSGGLTDYARAMISDKVGQPILNDVHGLMVFPSDPRPKLFRIGSPTLSVNTESEQLGIILSRALQANDVPGEREILAYDLFSSSFFEHSADARLLLLMMAVETLLVLKPRSAEAQAHVDSLISLISATAGALDLSSAERSSICGTLSWLKEESIGQAGRKLARTLGVREYDGMPPAKFFTTAYSLRSSLVHGKYPRPSRDQVGRTAASLEVFVADLLAGSLRHVS